MPAHEDQWIGATPAAKTLGITRHHLSRLARLTEIEEETNVPVADRRGLPRKTTSGRVIWKRLLGRANSHRVFNLPALEEYEKQGR